MWGAKLHKRRDLIQGVTRALIQAGQDTKFATDQWTLDNILWPTAKYDVVYKDSLQSVKGWRFLKYSSNFSTDGTRQLPMRESAHFGNVRH